MSLNLQPVDCPICLETIERAQGAQIGHAAEAPGIPGRGARLHIYHPGCLAKALKDRRCCPDCRGIIARVNGELVAQFLKKQNQSIEEMTTVEWLKESLRQRQVGQFLQLFNSWPTSPEGRREIFNFILRSHANLVRYLILPVTTRGLGTSSLSDVQQLKTFISQEDRVGFIRFLQTTPLSAESRFNLLRAAWNKNPQFFLSIGAALLNQGALERTEAAADLFLHTVSLPNGRDLAALFLQKLRFDPDVLHNALFETIDHDARETASLLIHQLGIENETLSEALLHAISTKRPEIAQAILQHPRAGAIRKPSRKEALFNAARLGFRHLIPLIVNDSFDPFSRYDAVEELFLYLKSEDTEDMDEKLEPAVRALLKGLDRRDPALDEAYTKISARGLRRTARTIENSELLASPQ